MEKGVSELFLCWYLWSCETRSSYFSILIWPDRIAGRRTTSAHVIWLNEIVISVFGIIKSLAVRYHNLFGFPSPHRQVQVSFGRLCIRRSMLERKLIYGLRRWWGRNTKDLVKISHSLMRIESRRGWMTWLLVANMVASLPSAGIQMQV